MRFGEDERSATPVVGNILLVALVVILAATIGTLALAFLEDTGTPSGEAAFEFEETPSGVQLRPVALGTDAAVELNGRRIGTLDADESGQSILLPTAPEDTVTVVAREGNRGVLLRERIDERSEVGDFIAYYTFDEDSGTTLSDRSGNGNTGQLVWGGTPDWQPGRGCLSFDGDDYVDVTDISAPIDVEEFTVAVTYRQTAVEPGVDDGFQQLVEHTFGGGNEWFLETKDDTGTSYGIHYAVNFPSDVIESESFGETYGAGSRHVAVATYDGSEYTLYVDGTAVATRRFSRPVDMGDMHIGRDFERDIQYFNGDVCEMRLYYQSFGPAEVGSLTAAMD